MNFIKFLSTRPLAAKALVLACGSITCAAAHGQAYVDPASQPFLTLAPYVLESSNLEPRQGNLQGGTFAYRPWFESGAWSGDVIRYRIDKDGGRAFPGGTVGLFPRNGDGWNTVVAPLWSARYTFPDFQPYNEADETQTNWACTEAQGDRNYWETRNIFTLKNGAKINFWWSELSEEQRRAVDLGQYNKEISTSGGGNKWAAKNSPILNFLRGDRSLESCKRLGSARGPYRWRFSILGAVANSRPVHIPHPTTPMVVAGANDGMLHAFDTSNGSELWAYIPSIVLNKLDRLSISPYRPQFFVDGELRHANIGNITTPRNIVAGGLGAGGKGLFVLDVTTPGAPTVSIELSGTHENQALPFVGGSLPASAHLGYIHGRPSIARLKNDGGRWYVVTGNGYGSDSDTAKLILLPLNADGTIAGTPIIWSTGAMGNNGLSAPALIDSTGDGFADLAYAGDLQGNLWRFDLDKVLTQAPPVQLFITDTALDPDTTLPLGRKPITAAPDVTPHPEAESGFMIYFGTGSLLSAADARNTQTQSIYGIWDRGRSFTATVQDASVVKQKLVTTTATWDVPQDGNPCVPAPDAATKVATVRFVAGGQRLDWLAEEPAQLGWQVDLPRAGERLLGAPQVRAERVQFITTNPVDMLNTKLAPDLDSGSWIMQLDLASGQNAKTPRALFDLNKNCTLDTGDGAPDDLTVDGESVASGTFPIGLNVGPFNVSQPAFARVSFSDSIGSVVDGVYINALEMPHRDLLDNVVHGPLDVTTDSPRGPAHKTVSYEPLRAPFLTPNQTTPITQASGPTKPFVQADGLGHRVDGHSFAYNRHHGVNFVDLFELEPQRGGLETPYLPHNLRLDIGAMYRDGSGFKPIPPGTPSERELNRPTEVIHPAQKFIIVVANADLSRENSIKIGCDTWPVYKYQTMVTEALRLPTSSERMAKFRELGLIFSLSEGPDAIRPEGKLCGDGTRPTIRVTPTERIGVANATMHSLPGCVNNTDLYAGSASTGIHLTRKFGLTEEGEFVPDSGIGPVELHHVDPHVTRALDPVEWQGYRWRNGALTLQLLEVGPGDEQLFEIQPFGLPIGTGLEGRDRGWGGAYAKAFELDERTSADGTVVTLIKPLTDGTPTDDSSPTTSGMLYELSLFWHWGDMADFQTSGSGTPVNPVCLGAAGHQPRIMFEGDWFTSGDYLRLTKDFDVPTQILYLQLLQRILSGDEAALDEFAALLASNAKLADYHRLRHYVPNSKQLGRNQLIELDRGALRFEVGLDGTPVRVEEIEADLLPSLGPNYRPGRRSWIDIAPDS